MESSLTRRMDRKGEHRTLVPTNLHPASGNSIENYAQSRAQRGDARFRKERRPQIPAQAVLHHPVAFQQFAKSRVHTGGRVIDTEHRAGKFPSVSWLGEFSFHEGGSRFP